MRLQEVRHGRNFIRHGDLVRVKPSRSGHHDGFLARFQYAEGSVYALTELDNHGCYQRHRFVRNDRVRRIARGGRRNDT